MLHLQLCLQEAVEVVQHCQPLVQDVDSLVELQILPTHVVLHVVLVVLPNDFRRVDDVALQSHRTFGHEDLAHLPLHDVLVHVPFAVMCQCFWDRLRPVDGTIDHALEHRKLYALGKGVAVSEGLVYGLRQQSDVVAADADVPLDIEILVVVDLLAPEIHVVGLHLLGPQRLAATGPPDKPPDPPELVGLEAPADHGAEAEQEA
mmetsp:Transcript_16975/g.47037  ORF Transcript_16975/g.47037 Transcript_16975/m.47037 type:complete len:204 (-) Transcript_16975:536-1147(-)